MTAGSNSPFPLHRNPLVFLLFLSQDMGKEPIKYFVVDAFTDSAFKGNPAAVCLLEEEKDEKWLQAVAAEFNFSETAFLTRIDDTNDVTSNPRFRLRWFTPVAEASLCGHATLAASHALFTNGLVNSSIIEFVTLAGILTAKKVPEMDKLEASTTRDGEAQKLFFVELDFPATPSEDFDSVGVGMISKALNGASVVDIRRTSTPDDLIVILPSGKDVMELLPKFDEIMKCPGEGIIVSGIASPESGFDIVSRYFFPKYGVNEDPVTGSAHCALAPYWSKKLGKCDFTAFQASSRSGILNIHFEEQTQRVLLRGKAVIVTEGFLLV